MIHPTTHCRHAKGVVRAQVIVPFAGTVDDMCRWKEGSPWCIPFGGIEITLTLQWSKVNSVGRNEQNSHHHSPRRHRLSHFGMSVKMTQAVRALCAYASISLVENVYHWAYITYKMILRTFSDKYSLSALDGIESYNCQWFDLLWRVVSHCITARFNGRPQKKTLTNIYQIPPPTQISSPEYSCICLKVSPGGVMLHVSYLLNQIIWERRPFVTVAFTFRNVISHLLTVVLREPR